MFDKDLKLDGKLLKKQKTIRARRPSEYWLLFFKRYILVKQSKPFRLRYLLFGIPVLILIVYFLGIGNFDADTLIPVFMVSVFVSFLANVLLSQFFDKNAFIDTHSYNELAKFIIDIKGDVYRNLINLRLNFDTLEHDKYELASSKIGLKNTTKTKYFAYQTERFNAGLMLKDGSLCNVALHQVSVKVKTTKRRSSGKVKTKYKFKHKLFYSLALKLKTSDYKCVSEDKLKFLQDVYNITMQKENDLVVIKVKHKEKLMDVSSSVSPINKRSTSVYTKMLSYLIDQQVIISKASNTSLSQKK
jgi:hypothetical protein